MKSLHLPRVHAFGRWQKQPFKLNSSFRWFFFLLVFNFNIFSLPSSRCSDVQLLFSYFIFLSIFFSFFPIFLSHYLTELAKVKISLPLGRKTQLSATIWYDMGWQNNERCWSRMAFAKCMNLIYDCLLESECVWEFGYHLLPPCEYFFFLIFFRLHKDIFQLFTHKE